MACGRAPAPGLAVAWAGKAGCQALDRSRLMRRFRQLIEARDVPLLGFDNRWVFAVGVDPAVDRPSLPVCILFQNSGPVRPAGHPAQQVLLGEGCANGVVLEEP